MPDDTAPELSAVPSSAYHRADNWVVDARLFDATASDDDKAAASRALGRAFLSLLAKTLGERLPLDRICFLDVVTIVPPGLSRGFLLAPANGADAYLGLIQELLGQQKGVADHPVFAAGLPSAAGTGPVQTERELAALLTSLRGKDVENVQRSYFAQRVTTPGVASLRYDSRLESPIGKPDSTGRNEVPSLGDSSGADLASFPVVYDSPSSQIARARYGGSDAKISDNLSALQSLLNARRDALRSPNGQSLAYIYAVPVATWILKPTGDVVPLSQGAFFLGLSQSMALDLPVLEAIQGLVSITVGSAMRSHIDSIMGRRSEAFSFAHQTSKTIDSLLLEAQQFSPDIQQAHGFFLAKLHLLRAVVDTYREGRARVDLGKFPYPWREDECPLAAYRDIGLQLGLARAQEGDAGRAVQRFGLKLIRREYQPGTSGFDSLIHDLFEDLPDCGHASRRLQASGFAVLALLAIQQAVYHTIRAQSGTQPNGRQSKIRIALQEVPDSGVVVCTVENPEVASDDSAKTAKDEHELELRAMRLSVVGDVTYRTRGPFHNEGTCTWVTTIEILPGAQASL